MTLFLDCSFFLLIDGSIAFDDELQAQQVSIVDGDRFIASVVDNKIMFKKIKTSVHNANSH